MTANPYAPPSANLDCDKPTCRSFYVVSKSKFLLLYLSTSGWYFVYWFYQNWKLYRAGTGTKVLPLIRTILGVLFVYSLFTKIDRQIRASGQDYCWYPRCLALAVIFIGCTGTALVWIPDLQIRFALSLLVLCLQSFCLLRVQGAINYLENDADGFSNSRLTFANGVWVALGVVCWSVAIYGYYILLQGQSYISGM